MRLKLQSDYSLYFQVSRLFRNGLRLEHWLCSDSRDERNTQTYSLVKIILSYLFIFVSDC